MAGDEHDSGQHDSPVAAIVVVVVLAFAFTGVFAALNSSSYLGAAVLLVPVWVVWGVVAVRVFANANNHGAQSTEPLPETLAR